MIRLSKWHQLDAYTDAATEALVSLRAVKDELTVMNDDVILRGSRLVLPAVLHTRAIELAHEGHQGLTKTKALIRSKVWFPGIDSMTECILRKCIPCQANSNRQHSEPLNMSMLPSGPWRNLSADFCGPLPTGEYLLVITYEYSRYPVVELTRSTSAEKVIPIVEKVFAMFGYPVVVKTDNGPPFQGIAWKDYLTSVGVRHRKITPLWPQANTQAESFNKPLMKAIRAAIVQGSNWRTELQKFLRMYRASPHCSTLFAPHRLMFGWEPRTKIPTVVNSDPRPDDQLARHNDAAAKTIMKARKDLRASALKPPINIGDVVLVRQQRKNKFSTRYNPKPRVATNAQGSMITAAWKDGTSMTRNSSQFHAMPITPTSKVVDSDIPPSSPVVTMSQPDAMLVSTRALFPPRPRVLPVPGVRLLFGYYSVVFM